jgi:hypothetical protein
MPGPPAAPAWFDELPLDPGPPWLSMGTRGLGTDRLLVVDDQRDAYLARKQSLLLDPVTRHEVAIELPSGVRAAAEAAELIAAHAGSDALDRSLPPLEAAALLVQEDLAVLVRRDGGWHLDAGVVCFPSQWSPRSKLGLPITAVHGPVPHYEDELAAKVDRFLDRLHPERPAWRRIWMLHADPELHVPRPTDPAAHADARVPDDLWLRTERQVLVALPHSSGILFTIRTEQVPLATLAGRPDLAARMAATARAWTPALAAYRANVLVLPRLLAWLDSVSSQVSS